MIKKYWVAIVAIIGFVGAAGGAWAVLADIPLPWEPRPNVWEIAGMTCEDQRDRIWRRQDYLDQKLKQAQRDKNWNEALRRKEQIRTQNKIEVKINNTCKRYDKK